MAVPAREKAASRPVIQVSGDGIGGSIRILVLLRSRGHPNGWLARHIFYLSCKLLNCEE